MYTNTVTLLEMGVEGNNGIVYTPTANQPGFVPGFTTLLAIAQCLSPRMRCWHYPEHA